MAFGPSVTADASLVFDANGRIKQAIVGNHGLDYIRPPIVTIDPGAKLTGINAMLRAFLNVFAVIIDNGGTGYPDPGTTLTFVGGLPPAQTNIISGSVSRIAMEKPGLGYAPGTVAIITGGGNGGSSPIRQAKASCVVDEFGRITDIVLTDMGAGYIKQPVVNFAPPGGIPPTRLAKAAVLIAEGTPAQAHVTIAAGVITAVTIDDPGSGYVGVPDVVITTTAPPTTLASLHAQMEVERVDVLNSGIGYQSTAMAVFTPFFKSAFPDISNQARPFNRFMELLLRDRVVSPIRSLTPVLI
jgi:hypothetical protein